MTALVDTHCHIYHPDEVRYPMRPEPYRPPAGTGTIEQLRTQMAACGVGRAVLVQTGSAYGWDNRLLAATATAHKDRTVGVCTLDPTASNNGEELRRLCEESNVRGVRVEAAEAGFAHAGSRRLWAAAQELGVVICAHLRLPHLRELAALLRAYPAVPVVLDHCAYPEAGKGIAGPTVQAVGQLAVFRQLHLKLSFGVTSSRQEYPFADTHPILLHLIQVFGADRCMWGSDFPCEHWLQKATYAQHLDLFRAELELSPGERKALLEETPARVWFDG